MTNQMKGFFRGEYVFEGQMAMQLKTKTINRKFQLINCLSIPEAEEWANEVIEGIEDDRLLVFDPKDENALDEVLDQEGND